jgi:hypothetical protein
MDNALQRTMEQRPVATSKAERMDYGAFASASGAIVSIRCPKCQKLLAKCCSHGLIEIVCSRCHALVRTFFS